MRLSLERLCFIQSDLYWLSNSRPEWDDLDLLRIPHARLVVDVVLDMLLNLLARAYNRNDSAVHFRWYALLDRLIQRCTAHDNNSLFNARSKVGDVIAPDFVPVLQRSRLIGQNTHPLLLRGRHCGCGHGEETATVRELMQRSSQGGSEEGQSPGRSHRQPWTEH